MTICRKETAVGAKEANLLILDHSLDDMLYVLHVRIGIRTSLGRLFVQRRLTSHTARILIDGGNPRSDVSFLPRGVTCSHASGPGPTCSVHAVGGKATRASFVHFLRRIIMMASRIASRSAQGKLRPPNMLAATRRVLFASVPRQSVMPASMMTSTPYVSWWLMGNDNTNTGAPFATNTVLASTLTVCFHDPNQS